MPEYPPEPWRMAGDACLSAWQLPVDEAPAVPAGLEPLVVAGRALVLTAWVRYRAPSPLTYDELLAAVAVRSGRQIAGLLAPDHSRFLSTEEEMYQSSKVIKNKFVGNTTIGAVLTNARFTKTEANKIAAMAQNGLVRAIRPVNTTADGDSLYALSSGDVEADLDMVGTLAAQVVSQAILRAVDTAESGYGLPARGSLPWA